MTNQHKLKKVLTFLSVCLACSLIYKFIVSLSEIKLEETKNLNELNEGSLAEDTLDKYTLIEDSLANHSPGVSNISNNIVLNEEIGNKIDWKELGFEYLQKIIKLVEELISEINLYLENINKFMFEFYEGLKTLDYLSLLQNTMLLKILIFLFLSFIVLKIFVIFIGKKK